MQVFTQTNQRGSNFQHFITPTLTRSNNQPGYSPDPLLEQKSSHKVVSLASGLRRRASAQSWSYEAGTIHYWSRDGAKPREGTQFWHWSLRARQAIPSLNLGFCLQDHALLALKKKKGPQIHTLRQTAHYWRRRHIKSGRVEKRRCLMERTERRKRKQSPNASLFVFRLALSNHPQHLPAK